jgi:hypothetical protein
MAVSEILGVLEVPLRGFCCKARGGGGRLRHATVTKAVALASACLYHMIYSSNVLISYIILVITPILTITPDCEKKKTVCLDSFAR